MRFCGGGVVAENCRDLKTFPWSPKAYAIQWGGGVVAAEFLFSVTSKRHFPLMGPFTFFYFPEGGARAPWPPPLNRPLNNIHKYSSGIT